MESFIAKRKMKMKDDDNFTKDTILPNGTKLYQQGGKPNIFEPILTDNRIDNL